MNDKAIEKAIGVKLDMATKWRQNATDIGEDTTDAIQELPNQSD